MKHCHAKNNIMKGGERMRKLTDGQKKNLEYCINNANGNRCPSPIEIYTNIQMSKSMMYDRIKSLVKNGYLNKLGGAYFLNDELTWQVEQDMIRRKVALEYLDDWYKNKIAPQLREWLKDNSDVVVEYFSKIKG